jgi:hypothetical protein
VLDSPTNRSCANPDYYAYRIRDKIKVRERQGSKEVQGRVLSQSGSLAGFDLPVTGTLKGECAVVTLTLSFHANITVAKETTTEIVIDVPKRMIGELQEKNGLVASNGPPSTEERISIASDNASDEEINFTLSATVGNSGLVISNCQGLHADCRGQLR